MSKPKDSKHLKPRKRSRRAVINSPERVATRLKILRFRCELELGEIGASVALRDAQWAAELALDGLRERSRAFREAASQGREPGGAHVKPQTQTVLRHLESGQALTALQALDLFGCLRLAARIDEIRGAGFVVETRLVTKGAKRFARYRLGSAR